MSGVHVYSSSPDSLTALFIQQTGRQPVVGNTVIVGNTRWSLVSDGRWQQDPVANIRLERRSH